MGLGGVDKILVVQLSVCQFWQETGRTGKLAGSSPIVTGSIRVIAAFTHDLVTDRATDVTDIGTANEDGCIRSAVV